MTENKDRTQIAVALQLAGYPGTGNPTATGSITVDPSIGTPLGIVAILVLAGVAGLVLFQPGRPRAPVVILSSLAFLSPRIVAAIVNGTAPANLTLTSLAKVLPYSWAEQEQRIGNIQ